MNILKLSLWVFTLHGTKIPVRYYFWDATKSPAFEICYVVYATSIVVFVFGYIAVITLFGNICMCFVGLYDHLMATMRHIDTCPAHRRRQHIVAAIKYHCDIIRHDASSALFQSHCAKMFLSIFFCLQFCRYG